MENGKMRILCGICDVKFIKNSNNQKFCKDCYKINKKRLNKKWVKENPLRVKELLEKHTKTEKYRITRKNLIDKYKKDGRWKKMYMKYKRLRRARKNRVLEIFTVVEWNDKLEMTYGFCPKCDTYVGIDKLTLDHVLPISKAPVGYMYDITKVNPLCMPCNAGKRDKVSA